MSDLVWATVLFVLSAIGYHVTALWMPARMSGRYAGW